MEIGLNHYLFLAAILFAIGLFGLVTRRNAISILMSLELMFNAININMVAFNRFTGSDGLVGHRAFAASMTFLPNSPAPSVYLS